MPDVTIPGTDGFVLRAAGPDEHDNRDVMAPDGEMVATVYYTRFSGRWHGVVGPDVTMTVADALTAGRQAVLLWKFSNGDSAREPTLYFGHAHQEVPEALTQLRRRWLEVHRAAASAYTAWYGRQPHVHTIDAALAELEAQGRTRLRTDALLDGLDALNAPASAWRTELITAGASEAREWLVYPLTRLLYDSQHLQGRLRATRAEARRRAGERLW
ncbi:hypothetical protein [Streptomyces sp. BRA346]|uniref:hypothetical protein n=1 Tax=Streptomyces sp. BRA346 TaxID=2878199 RepID=UPI004063B3D2